MSSLLDPEQVAADVQFFEALSVVYGRRIQGRRERRQQFRQDSAMRQLIRQQTRREQVIEYAELGLNDQQIAEVLGVSELYVRTVKEIHARTQ